MQFVFSPEIRVTILKDKNTRESKGVAFVLFLDRQTAQKAVAAVNSKQVLGSLSYYNFPKIETEK